MCINAVTRRHACPRVCSIIVSNYRSLAWTLRLMHRALLLFEVLVDIFAYVNQISDPSSTGEKPLARKSLAALATTCKTFHEPAMNELWADICGLKPLLGCVTRLHPMVYHGGKYIWTSQGVAPLSGHEGLLPIETCMFPRLLSLSTVPDPTKYLYLFLSPMLRRCDLPVVHPDLKSIVTRCAALEDLSIRHNLESKADKLSLLSHSVRLCKRLVNLSCPPLDCAAWEHLSNLPTLLTIRIGKGSRVPSPLNIHNLKFALFLNLTTLSYHAKTAKYITTVLKHSEFPSLKRFEMIVDELHWTEAEQLCCALSQCKARQTLEHIAMDSFGLGFHERSDDSLTAITQFLCFTQLRTLRVMLHHPIFLDNDLLLEAISSWPHIRSLKIEDPRCRPPTVTFRGLFAALRQCPHLHTLQILIDAVNIDIDPKAESFQHTTLHTLDLAQSWEADAEAVARIIFSMLPCVDMVSRLPDLSHLSHAWHDVNKHLKSLKSSPVPGRHITGAPLNT
ncbi:hypothetical protein DFH29DRAFT_880347 [Suillus ampliporus]|nr:hypothetical protein DFH29DRAFT_880347 [Suillus ampliporus]